MEAYSWVRVFGTQKALTLAHFRLDFRPVLRVVSGLMDALCDHHPTCRAYHLTVSAFERLGGERWTQSFRVRLGLLANKRYAELYGKKPRKVRSSTTPNWRNKVCKYPCGILEQAYRELRDGPSVTSRIGATHNKGEGQTTAAGFSDICEDGGGGSSA
jgi:hypothetical protein